MDGISISGVSIIKRGNISNIDPRGISWPLTVFTAPDSQGGECFVEFKDQICRYIDRRAYSNKVSYTHSLRLEVYSLQFFMSA